MMSDILFNAGSIQDIPVEAGRRVSVEGRSFAVFRETFGHFYAFTDQRADATRGLHNGRIKDGKICLPDGRNVDLHTGRLDESERFFTSVLSWVDNGFIFLSISSLLLILKAFLLFLHLRKMGSAGVLPKP